MNKSTNLSFHSRLSKTCRDVKYWLLERTAWIKFTNLVHFSQRWTQKVFQLATPDLKITANYLCYWVMYKSSNLSYQSRLTKTCRDVKYCLLVRTAWMKFPNPVYYSLRWTQQVLQLTKLVLNCIANYLCN